MSKKNNKNTQRNQHAFDLRREKEAIQKRKQNQQKKAEKAPKRKGVRLVKNKNRGFRIKKNVVIKGIKIKDAESKQKARELLAAEQAMREMDVEPQPKAQKSKTLKAKVQTKEIDAMEE